MQKLHFLIKRGTRTVQVVGGNYFKIVLIVVCVSRPKSASFSSESEFSGRGAAEARQQARTKGIFRRPHELQSTKQSLEKLQIYFKSTFFK
jgi:hypothetical protein